MRGFIIVPRQTPCNVPQWLEDPEEVREKVFHLKRRCWCPSEPKRDLGVRNDDEAFGISLDVPGFTPEMLSVEIKEGVLEVSGKKEVKEEGFQSLQEFRRRFPLPEDVNSAALSCQFKEGKLEIEAPKKETKKNEISIPVTVVKPQLEEKPEKEAELGENETEKSSK